MPPRFRRAFVAAVARHWNWLVAPSPRELTTFHYIIQAGDAESSKKNRTEAGYSEVLQKAAEFVGKSLSYIVRSLGLNSSKHTRPPSICFYQIHWLMQWLALTCSCKNIVPVDPVWFLQALL